MFNYVLCVSKLKESYKHPVQVRKKGPSDVLCEQIFTVQPCRHVQKNFQPTLPLQMETCKNPFPFHFMFSSCVFWQVQYLACLFIYSFMYVYIYVCVCVCMCVYVCVCVCMFTQAPTPSLWQPSASSLYLCMGLFPFCFIYSLGVFFLDSTYK